MAAAACNDDAPDGGLAAWAGFSFAVVNAMVMLVIAGNTVGIEEIGNGRTAEGDGLTENFLEFGIEDFDLIGLQVRTTLSGMNFGAPQAFVGVNISDAANDGLIEEQGFNVGAPTVDQGDESFASGFKRIGAEAEEFLL